MIIQFKKEANKPASLVCIREDGSKTWTKITPGIEIHDLAHYVVETELSFKNAFYGLLKAGYAIHEFELPASERPEALRPKNLPEEALQTEHLVNLIQVHFQSKMDPAEFLKQLNSSLKDRGLSPISELNEHKLLTILTNVETLFMRWRSLKSGEQLELKF